MPSGGILQAEGRPVKRAHSLASVSSNVKKVLGAVEVDGVDEEVVERLRVGSAQFPLLCILPFDSILQRGDSFRE